MLGNVSFSVMLVIIDLITFKSNKSNKFSQNQSKQDFKELDRSRQAQRDWIG